MKSYEQQSTENFWGATLELKEETVKPQAPDPSQNGTAAPGTHTNPSTQNNAAAAAPKPFNRQVAEAKARMGTAAIDFGLRITLAPIANMRMKKLYSKYIPDEQEQERAAELILENKPPATDRENRNMKYMEKLLKKHGAINDNIQLNEQQRKDLVRIVADYEEATGKSLSPSLVMWSGILGTLGVKFYEVFTLDINPAGT